MRFGQGFAGLIQQRNHALGRQRAVLRDQIRQALAGQVFHHVVKCAVVGVAVIEDSIVFQCESFAVARTSR